MIPSTLDTLKKCKEELVNEITSNNSVIEEFRTRLDTFLQDAGDLQMELDLVKELILITEKKGGVSNEKTTMVVE